VQERLQRAQRMAKETECEPLDSLTEPLPCGSPQAPPAILNSANSPCVSSTHDAAAARHVAEATSATMDSCTAAAVSPASAEGSAEEVADEGVWAQAAQAGSSRTPPQPSTDSDGPFTTPVPAARAVPGPFAPPAGLEAGAAAELAALDATADSTVVHSSEVGAEARIDSGTVADGLGNGVDSTADSLAQMRIHGRQGAGAALDVEGEGAEGGGDSSRSSGVGKFSSDWSVLSHGQEPALASSSGPGAAAGVATCILQESLTDC
jgi:hypothetical protein